ncbi:MAG: hypothetical protein K0M45_09480 [Candidatus Paracaedibacteraceae bacterium]|nr:hypothetical protein [Candidatus Paracaedibacteraceae bacterium]
MFSILKNYVASWQQQKLAFGYNLACSVEPAGLVLTLHLQQQQTEFSLSITLHRHRTLCASPSFLSQKNPTSVISANRFMMLP